MPPPRTIKSNEFDDPTATRSAYTGPAPFALREVGSVADSDRWVARFSWALVVLAIISAVAQLSLTFGWLVPFPDVADSTPLPDRLLAFRTGDQQTFWIVAVGSLASLGVFLVGSLVGVALRPLARAGTARDVMTTLFVVGGGVGIVGQLVNLGVNNAATFGYCDCGFRDTELIAQDYALSVGWTVVNWFLIGSVTIVGIGVATAGRLVSVSSAWRTLSYLIAVVILLAVVIRVTAAFVFIEAFDPFQVTDLMVALAAGILVPIWAILLARGVSGRAAAMPEPAGA